MIRLWNHTPIEDAPIRAVLTYAARRIGVKGSVCVKITGNRATSRGYQGFAKPGWPYLSYLQNKPQAKWGPPSASGPGGWIEIALPWDDWAKARMEIYAAQNFLHSAMHEMSHILDYRQGIRFGPLDGRQVNGRRIAHDKRPCEIRAENRVYDAMQGTAAKRRTETLALDLAIAIEAAYKAHKGPEG